jgi:hypothetical protein
MVKASRMLSTFLFGRTSTFLPSLAFAGLKYEMSRSGKGDRISFPDLLFIERVHIRKIFQRA